MVKVGLAEIFDSYANRLGAEVKQWQRGSKAQIIM